MSKALVWLRRDLRVNDHAALSYATSKFDQVYLVFIFDTKILDKLNDKEDPRVYFIWNAIKKIQDKVPLSIFYGDPVEIIPKLEKELNVDEVVAARDYEVYAKKRDSEVSKKLSGDLILVKDTVVFESHEVLNGSGKPYKVFTPYKNNWLSRLLDESFIAERKVKLEKVQDFQSQLNKVSQYSQIGFEPVSDSNKLYSVDAKSLFKKFQPKVDEYDNKRDLPAVDGTSKLSVHLRFGTISVRELLRKQLSDQSKGSQVWVSELAWRDFYFAVLNENPHIEKKTFILHFNDIPYENDKKLFQAWCEGKTGVPIVDAGMRQLNQTGWMHNRVRMIVASYLIKTLLIDWRWGEKYFAQKLIDFDLAANNGGWQWSASTGCDAAPYFRVFNPYRQSERFDKSGEYIKKFVPEVAALSGKYLHDPTLVTLDIMAKTGFKLGEDYPYPVANYKANRVKVIAMYKAANEKA